MPACSSPWVHVATPFNLIFAIAAPQCLQSHGSQSPEGRSACTMAVTRRESVTALMQWQKLVGG